MFDLINYEKEYGRARCILRNAVSYGNKSKVCLVCGYICSLMIGLCVPLSD